MKGPLFLALLRMTGLLWETSFIFQIFHFILGENGIYFFSLFRHGFTEFPLSFWMIQNSFPCRKMTQALDLQWVPILFGCLCLAFLFLSLFCNAQVLLLLGYEHSEYERVHSWHEELVEKYNCNEFSKQVKKLLEDIGADFLRVRWRERCLETYCNCVLLISSLFL